MTLRVQPKIGSVVRYSDMENAGSTFIVLEKPHRDMQYGWWTQYIIRATEAPYTLTASDLRQRGWKIFYDETETWEEVLA
jgi:hypothetical protein